MNIYCEFHLAIKNYKIPMKFLKHIDFVKKVDSSASSEYSIEKNYPFIASEKSLAEDWLREEDNRWDDVLNN